MQMLRRAELLWLYQVGKYRHVDNELTFSTTLVDYLRTVRKRPLTFLLIATHRRNASYY